MARQKAQEKDARSSATIVKPHDINMTDEHGATPQKERFSQCVRTLMQNWRQGTVACKGRSDVAFSNKKPWKQKGTGRARAGSARSPLWRGGGVIFGPQPRTRTMTVSKNLKKAVCSSILRTYMNNEAIMSLNWEPQEGAPKTSHAYNALKQAGLANKSIIFFVRPEDTTTHMSFANIPNVRMLLYDQWNVYDISNGDVWLFLQKDSDSFKKDGERMALTLFDIIRGPRITEKAYRLNQLAKKLVLEIHPKANKPLVEEALKKLFNVEAEKVGIVVLKGKKRRAGKFFTTGKLRKKAIVTLKKGQSIDLMHMNEVQSQQAPAAEE